MKQISKMLSFKTVLTTLFILVAVKLVWSIVSLLWLPVVGVDHQEEHTGKPLFYRVKLTPNEAPAPVKKKTPVKKRSSGNIKNIKLIGIYDSGEDAVVVLIYKGKTKVITIGESVNGFTLDHTTATEAVFSKNHKYYTVKLTKNKRKIEKMATVTEAKDEAPTATDTNDETPEGNATEQQHRVLKRSEVDMFADNLSEVYKNIGIREVKKDGKLAGFRVTFIRRDSAFAKLGLRRGDVLKSINGEALDNYATAYRAYQNIQDTDMMTLKIERGNKEMELEYEID